MHRAPDFEKPEAAVRKISIRNIVFDVIINFE